MHAFVTGGTGFLGAHVVEVLAARGWRVTVLHRRGADLGNLANAPGIALAEGDITDPASLRRAMPEGVDAVVHAAGSAGHLPHRQEPLRYRINHQGTRNVVAECRAKRIGRLVHISTIATYDWRASRLLSEDAPPNDWCRDPYVHSKRLADREVEAGIQAGLDAVFIHPCGIIGRYDRDTWSKAFREIQRGLVLPLAPPGGLNVCHVRGAAEAVAAACVRGPGGRHYIIGGHAVTFLALFQEIARALGRPGPRWAPPGPLFKLFGWGEFLGSSLVGREPAFTPHTIALLSLTMLADGSRAERELGYVPAGVPAMIADCRDWMVATGRLPAVPAPGGTAAGLEPAG